MNIFLKKSDISSRDLITYFRLNGFPLTVKSNANRRKRTNFIILVIRSNVLYIDTKLCVFIGHNRVDSSTNLEMMPFY